MMDDARGWDPEDAKAAPRWRAQAVLNLLTGIPFEREDLHFAPGGRTGARYAVHTIVFGCGCTAADDAGWQSCGQGLHPFLSDCDPKGPGVAEFRSLRAVFDAVLEEAWKRRGGTAENYYEFCEARMRKPFLKFEKWQETHDLMGALVWKNGYLHADLDSIPMEQDILLVPSSARCGFELAYQDASGRRVLLGDPLEPIRSVFRV